jgi:hypothetical protein
MTSIKYQQLTEQGYDEQNSEIVSSDLVSEEIYSLSELDGIFKSDDKDNAERNSNVCIKTTIFSITHPFEFKVEMRNITHKTPLGNIVIKQPSTYRRSALYKVYSEICYPVGMIIQNVEKCAKQSAMAGVAAAATGNIAAAGVAVQAAFLACMAFSNASDAQKISIRVAGEKETGEWHSV